MSLDLDQAAEWVRLVCPPDTPGKLWIGSASTGFRGRRIWPDDPDTIRAEIARLDPDPGIFLRMGTIRDDAPLRGRGEMGDSATLFGLWADLDIEGPGHKHDPAKYEGRKLPPNDDAASDLVSHLPQPTAWVHSGGGLYAFWLPERPWRDDLPALAVLSADWQASIGQQAIKCGWHYGTGVGDIARILRIPGTVNRKVRDHPTPCRLLDAGGPRYEYAALRAAVPVASSGGPGAPGRPQERPATIVTPPGTRLVSPSPPWDEAGPGPLDDFASRHDLIELLVADGWYAHPRQRAGRLDLTRPGKDPRDGISANVINDGGRQVLYVFSEDAGLPVRRGLSPGDWYAYRYYGGSLTEAARSLRAAGYGAPSRGLGAIGRASGGPAGMAAPPAPPGPPVTVPDGAGEIWTRRPVLDAIHRLAHERLVGPWAVLGGVLAQVACQIGPHVVLPAIVGGHASLNVCIGLVGEPGAGKDAALAVAAELVHADGFPTHELGTGQGIDASYTMQTKEGPVQFNDTALFVATEIDTLAAHSRMQGATIMPTLRKIYTGAGLGAQYADQHKRRPVKTHHYRAAVVAGIQPAKSGVLLDDADGGTPQRWVWLPATGQTDPPRQFGRLVGPAPARWFTKYEAWAPQGEQADGQPVQRKRQVELQVCDQAIREVRENRRQRLARQVGEQARDLAGHALLTRLKVAGLLGLLDARTAINDDDWELAGVIMSMSEHTRTVCQNVLQQRHSERNRAKARAEGERVTVVQEAQDTAHVQAACRAILTRLARQGGELVRRDLRQIRSNLRPVFDEAIELLVTTGQITVQQRPDKHAPGGTATWYLPRGQQ